MALKFTWESRQYKRLNISIPVYITKCVQLKLRPLEKVKAVIENISRQGALVVTSVFLPKGAEFNIELTDVKSLPVCLPSEITLKVVYVKTKIALQGKKQTHIYMIGTRFFDLPEEISKLISDWAEGRLPSQRDKE